MVTHFITHLRNTNLLLGWRFPLLRSPRTLRKAKVFKSGRAGAKTLALLPTPYDRRNLRTYTSQFSAGGSSHGKCARDQAGGGIIKAAAVCIAGRAHLLRVGQGALAQ